MLCPWWVLRKHARGQPHRLGGVRGPVVAGELRFRAANHHHQLGDRGGGLRSSAPLAGLVGGGWRV